MNIGSSTLQCSLVEGDFWLDKTLVDGDATICEIVDDERGERIGNLAPIRARNG
jgi:hypothetical protein